MSKQAPILDQDKSGVASVVGSKKINRIITVILYIGVLIWIFPFYWMIITAIKTDPEIFIFPPTFIPRTFTFEAVRSAYESIHFIQTFTNSVIISVGAVLLQLVVCSLAGYPLARMKFFGREFIFLFFISTMMVPMNVTMSSNFMILKQLNWIDTYYALIVPFGASGLAIFIFRQFFRTIPQELEDAAKIDGCGRLGFLFRIVVPMAKPAFAAVAVFVWQGQWNQFLWPLIMTNSKDMWVIQVAISAFQDSWGTNHAEMAAAATFAALPPLIMFAFLQKYFIQGIAKTGIK